MDFIVKDRNVRPVAVVDLYSSAIWAERYSDAGEFELYLPLDSNYLDFLAVGNYLTIKDSDRAMIIESMQLESKLDSGEKVVLFKGGSLESILKRRIIWTQTSLTGNIVSVVESILNTNVISPGTGGVGRVSPRAIPNFIFGGAVDSDTTAYLQSVGTIECQFNGETVFDAIKSICDQVNLGFKIVFNDAGKFVFYLYYGTNRTLSQAVRDAIVFSPEYDTLISSRYLQDFTPYRNVALVEGEEKENEPRKREIVYAGSTEPSGLDRRELYVSASDIHSEEDGQTLSDSEYRNLLRYKGYLELQENKVTTAFDGEVETSIGPQFNRDYFLGDFVSTMNEFGLGSVAQITEYIRSYDAKGYSAYPSFVMIN